MEIKRIWAMPSKNTFTIKPIKELLNEELDALFKVNPNPIIVDPFANESKLGTVTNDLNPAYDTDFHMDALDFLKTFESNSVDMVLYDPPYSVTQVKQVYDGVGEAITNQCRSDYWRDVKKEIARITKVGGKVLSFSWNSGGIGKTNGMDLQRVLLVPHGGIHNDTIVTVETKLGAN